MTPDIDASLDEQEREDALLERVQGARRLVGRAARRTEPPGAAPAARELQAAVLLAALVAWDAVADRLPALSDRWDVALVALVLFPATFARRLAAAPARHVRAALLPRRRSRPACSRCCSTWPGADGARSTSRSSSRFTLFGFWFLSLFEALSWVVLVAAIIPWVDIASVYRGPTKVVVEQQPGLFERIVDRVPRCPARTAARGSARRT